MQKNPQLYIVLLALLPPFIWAQQRPIEKPEVIAGRWETADGHGGMLGMNIILTTHVLKNILGRRSWSHL